MPIFAADASNIDINRSRGRSRIEMHQIGLDSVPIPDTCPLVIPTGEVFSDDFNRPNNVNLGPNYTVFSGNSNLVQNASWLQIFNNAILMSPVSPLKPPNYDAMVKTARFNPFPINAKDQIASMTYQGAAIVATGGPQNQGFGTGFSICTRMIDNAPGNGWFEAGAGGPGTQSGTLQYELRYFENYSANGAFLNARLDALRNEITGTGGVTTDMAPAFPFPRLSSGDVLAFTAANYLPFGPGFEEVCLKAFVNGVQVGAWHDFSNPIPPNQHGRILTGGTGFTSRGVVSDPLNQAFFATMTWDDFQAQVGNPNPF